MSEKILQLMGRLPRNAPSVSHDSAVKVGEPAEAAGEAAVAAAVEDLQNKKRMKKASLVKLGAMCVFLSVAVVFMTISWFTMSREVGGKGMQMKSSSGLFELRTSGSAGLYDNYITRIDDKYSSGTETTPSSSKLILRLTNENQMENLWKKDTPPTQDDLDKIKKLESTQYGLSPGDHGVLKFSIVPVQNDSESFDVLIKPVITCYKTEFYTTDDIGHTAGYQKDIIIAMDPENASEAAAIGFTDSHIRMYYKADENDDDVDEMHMIPDDGFEIKGIDSETEVEIYWFWPEELSNILNLDIEDMDESAAAELRKDFFAHPDSYLEKIKDNEDFSDIVIPESGTETARGAMALDIIDSPTSYNYYSNRYNNADQTIGDKVGYIMVEIIADKPEH